MTTRKSYALVTEGGEAIGRAVCLKLAEMGHEVLISYSDDQEAAEQTKREVEALGRDAQLIQFNLTNPEEVKDGIDNWTTNHTDASIDILVNNSGARKAKPFSQINLGEWNGVLDRNINGFYHVSQTVLKGMVKSRKGRIITLVSDAGVICPEQQTSYSAANAALIAATKALSKEVGFSNITVNAVAPGHIKTREMERAEEKAVGKGLVIKRMGQPGEVSALVGFLASDKAGYISGQVISVNGGGLSLEFSNIK